MKSPLCNSFAACAAALALVLLAALAQSCGGQQVGKTGDKLVALRGTPPPTGTKTEQLLREQDVWGGQLDVNARVHPVEWLGGNISHLLVAALENDVEAARWLIANGADVNAIGDLDNTPLHFTAQKDAAEIAKLMIDAGADVNAIAIWGRSPLSWAAEHNAAEVAKLLIEHGADINVKDSLGDLPLNAAAEKNALEVVVLLIEHGADVNAEGYIGETPLHEAAQHHDAEIAKLLIKRGADVNAKNENGATPLHWAAVYNAQVTAKLLIESGANVDAKDSDNSYTPGSTPMDLAISEGLGGMQALLRRYGGRCNTRC